MHHVGGQRSDPPVSLELENNSSSNIDNISTDQLELFVRLEAAVVREEVSQGQSGQTQQSGGLQLENNSDVEKNSVIFKRA